MTVYKVYTEPYRAEITLVVGGWNIFNLILAGCALGVVSERRETRSSRRIAVERRCEVRGADGNWIKAVISDVSSGGLALRMPEGAAGLGRSSPTAVRFAPLSGIEINELQLFVQSTSSAGKGVVLGCRFMPERAGDYRLIADLLYANSSVWQERQRSRQVNIGIIRGTLQFLAIAVYQTGRGLGYFLRFSGAGTRKEGTE